jgi:hypothetical protein
LGTLNPQDGTPAPSSPLDQLVSATLATCSDPRAALSRASGFVRWPSSTGRGRQLCPGISDVNFLGNLDGIVNLNTKIADGALNFTVTEQKLNRTQISGSAVN